MPSVIKTTGYATVRRGDAGAARSSLTASARYYAHRPDHDRVREQRLAFDHGRDGLNREAVQGFIEREHGEAHRWILSPPPPHGRDWSEEQMHDWTRTVMRESEAVHEGRWIGYVHQHEAHPHVHAIVYTDEAVGRSDFERMRQAGDAALERVNERGYEREPDLEREAQYEAAQAHEREAGRDRGRGR